MRIRRRFLISLSLIVLVALASSDVFVARGPGAFSAIKIIDNGGDEGKLVIVIMGDGYAYEELAKFRGDAQKLVEGFFECEPFKSYSDLVNFYIIETVSKESGASANPDSMKDTYFGSSYYFDGATERLLGVKRGDRVTERLETAGLSYGVGVVLVNSGEHGGSGGEGIVVVSAGSQSSEIFLHELGHVYAGLADEYSDAGEWREAPNMTRNGDENTIKWKEFIGTGEIGVYSLVGAEGWHIPSPACKMGALGLPFCAVCEAAIIDALNASGLR